MAEAIKVGSALMSVVITKLIYVRKILDVVQKIRPDIRLELEHHLVGGVRFLPAPCYRIKT